MSVEKITVYSFRRCPFAIRVRMVLYEKNIPFELKEEDLSKLSDTVRMLHPEAKVPVLIHGDTILFESAIITEYIEDTFPKQSPLMPLDSGGKAAVRLWTYWCNQIFKPDLDRLKYGKSRFTEPECLGVEERIIGHLTKLEQRLVSFSEASHWLVGERLSLADIHVFPFVRQLLRIVPELPFLSRFPGVLLWAASLSARPSFINAMKKALASGTAPASHSEQSERSRKSD